MSDPVAYTTVPSVVEETVLFLSRLLAAERRRRGTRGRRRALGCYRQALLVLRWFLNGTRLAQLTGDNSNGYGWSVIMLSGRLDVSRRQPRDATVTPR